MAYLVNDGNGGEALSKVESNNGGHRHLRLHHDGSSGATGGAADLLASFAGAHSNREELEELERRNAPP